MAIARPIKKYSDIRKWNKAIEAFLYSDTNYFYHKKYNNKPFIFKTNIDFIKIILISYLRYIYFSVNQNEVREKVVNEIFTIMISNKELNKLAENSDFKEYLKNVITNLTENSDSIVVTYLKNDLFQSLQHYGPTFKTKHDCNNMIEKMCAESARMLGLKRLELDESKLNGAFGWIDKMNKNHLKKPTKTIAAATWQYMVLFFIALYSISIPLFFLGHKALATGIGTPSLTLGLLYSLHAIKKSTIADQEIHRTLSKLIYDKISIKLHHKLRNNELTLVLETTLVEPCITLTEPINRQPISSHFYRRNLPQHASTNQNNHSQLSPVVSSSSAQIQLGLLTPSHVRFILNKVIYDAYLPSRALPADKQEQEAIQGAFAKGYMASTVNKRPHAIVDGGKYCLFKIRTSCDGRMKSEQNQVVAPGATQVDIVFDHYDKKSHDARRENKGLTRFVS